MSRPAAIMALLLGVGAAGWGHAADLGPHDFAYGLPIRITGAGTAYHLTLPLEVYRNTSHEDLSDLRVFNAQGEVVPYEVRAVAGKPSAPTQGQSLVFFPLRADTRATLNGVRVTVQSAGANVDVHAGRGAPDDPAVITRYVLDARVLERPLSALVLGWSADAPDFSGAVRVESSDDLSSWRLAREDAPVVNLRTGRANLIQNRVELYPTKARFWRLTWVGKPAPFALTSVIAEPTPQQVASPQSAVTAGGTPVAKQEGETAFDLGGHLPVTEVNLLLPESNSALTIELLSRARATDPWRPVCQREFYRVGAGAAQRSNAAVHIPPDFDRFWLARQVNPGGRTGPLQLRASWDTQEVLFLPRGAGPFLLAYGNAAAGQASVSLEPLLRGITLSPASAGASFILGGKDRLLTAPGKMQSKEAVLWGALGLAVLVLAWMAYQLSRELGKRTDGTTE